MSLNVLYHNLGDLSKVTQDFIKEKEEVHVLLNYCWSSTEQSRHEDELEPF